MLQAANSLDLNHDNVIDSNDISSLENKLLGLLGSGPADDLSGDGFVNIADIIYLTNLINKGGTDPKELAPTLPPSVSSGFTSTTQFLYTGPQAPQTGVEPGTIDKTRAAIVRGRVLNAASQPLAGVSIRIHQHPEFGITLSRADGNFDMAVNGGGIFSIDYQKTGYMPAQRLVKTEWNDIVLAPEVRLMRPDPVVTAIDLTSTAAIQLAHSSMIQDQDGTRTGHLLIRSGTQAFMTLPGGTTQTLTMLHVRATEYTVGPGGPAAMPATLPAESGYTYCVELSADEALAANASQVIFNQPLYYYLNNFLAFPVGTDIPNGYYDRDQARWVASDNGEVLQVLNITDGLADLDVNGKEIVATAQELATRNIDDAERAKIAVLYAPGSRFWRVPIAHFTPWDCNWPFTLPPDARPPDNPPPKPEIPRHPEDCLGKGSIIGYRNQTLAESIPVAGLPFNLNYRSDRVPGRNDYYRLKFDVSGTTIPISLQTIVFDITVAGRQFSQSFAPAPGLAHEFQWDGKNIYGQEMSGAQTITVKNHYLYQGLYNADVNAQQASFARVMGAVGAGSGSGGGGGGGGLSVYSIVPMRPSSQADVSQTFTTLIGNFSAKNIGLGGWTLDVHHSYDVLRQRVFLGNGNFMDAKTNLPEVINTFAGNGKITHDVSVQPVNKSGVNGPFTLTAGPDGSIYTAEGATDYDTYQKFGYYIRRITPDGIISVIGGTGEDGFSGDGGPATSAKISQVMGLAVGPDGSIYLADTGNHRVRRIWPDGTIRTIAGNENFYKKEPDGSPPTAYGLLPLGISIAPDGRVFIADGESARVWVITTDGRMWTVAGKGGSTFPGLGDDGPAYQCLLSAPSAVAYCPDGNLYIADRYLRRVRPDGIIEAFGGNFATRGQQDDSIWPSSGDGGRAVDAVTRDVTTVAVSPDGVVYFQDYNRVRRVTQDGVINTIAGSPAITDTGDGGPATDAGLFVVIHGIAIGPDKALYIGDTDHNRIRRVAPAYSALQFGDHAIPASDGSEIYIFDEDGKHLRTIDAWTNAVLYTFQYNLGRLTAITDSAGNVTQIEHDATGNPTGILAPGGQHTLLTVDQNGYLANVTDPGAIRHQMTYTATGLLKSFTDPDNHASNFTYDDHGRLMRDDDALGGFTVLARGGDTTNSTVTVTQPGGQVQTLETRLLPRGEERRRHTHASGEWEEIYVRQNGSGLYSNSEGTLIKTDYAPDPRWGMGAKYIKSLSMTPPGGMTAAMTLQRTAVLADLSDPFSLVQQTDQATVQGQTDTTIYDAATRQFVTTTAGGRQNIKTLDAQGRVVAQQYDPALNTAITTFAYDVKGRLEQVARGDRSWLYSYNAANQLISRGNASGNKVLFTYTAGGRVARITDLNGYNYDLDYNGNGDVTSIMLPGNILHTLLYNGFHALTGYLPPGNPAMARTFNADRSLQSTQLPDGRTRNYNFDTGGRLTSVQYPEATITLAYEPNEDTPHILTYDRGAGFMAESLQIERSGELINQQQWSGAANAVMTYSYAQDMQLNGFTFAHGAVSVSTTITRDPDGLPTAWGPFNLTRSGPGGMPTVISDGSANWAITYDTLTRFSERRLSFGGTEAFREQFVWNNLDRLAQKSETINGALHSFVYTYDAGGRLIQVDRDGTLSEQYVYDDRGNRISQKYGAGVTEGCTYDSQDRLQSLGSNAYQFDTTGFLQQRGSDTFQYGTRGELLQASIGGQTVQYMYDGYGRRVARTTGANTSQYFYGNLDNPLQVTAAVNAAGEVSYFWYDDGGRLLAMERGGVHYTIAVDQVGTARLITDSLGNAIKIMDYDSFGRILSDSNVAFEFPFGFAGGLHDSLSGLDLLGYRDYDPAAGRWTTRDPALYNGGPLNLYTYCYNDPTSLMDWNGFTSIEASAYEGIGGGVKVGWNKQGFSFCAEIGFGAGSEVEVSPSDALDKNEVSLVAKLEGKVGLLKAGVEVEIHECAKVEGKLKGCAGVACLGTESGPSLEADPGHGDTNLKDLFKKTKPKVGGAGAGVEGKVAGKFCFQQLF